MNYLDYTQMDLQNERALLCEYEKKIEQLPEGRLVCKKINGTLQHYHVHEDGKETILNQNNLELILDLRLKKRLVVSCKRIKRNIRFQESLLNQYRPYELYQIEKDLPFSYKEDTLRKWANAKYRRNTFKEEKKIFKTSFGLKVRSKSELLIAELLYAAGIFFRYDEEITLNDANGKKHYYCPDFTILTPSGKVIYWEHWGMYDKEDYRERNYAKLELYFQNGITLSDNLIITMDTVKGGIDAMSINRVIKGQVLIHF